MRPILIFSRSEDFVVVDVVGFVLGASERR